MEDRHYRTLLTVGVILLVALAGCSESGVGETTPTPSATDVQTPTDAPPPSPTATSAPENTPPPTVPPTATPSPTPAPTPTPAPSHDYTVVIDYSGEWQGSVGYTTGGGSSTQRSVSGSGQTTVEIDASDVLTVSATAQKMDDGDGQLSVKILQDGTVVNSAQTQAQYGVVTVSESFF